MSSGFPPSPRLSIVVPVLNDAAALERLLEDLSTHMALFETPVELLVVDGGSTDDSRTVALKYGASLLDAPRGRGQQLNTGCRAARGDWLWLLHADTRPDEDAVREMCAEASRAGTVGWGGHSVRFDDGSAQMRLTAALMNARSRLTGICTGDQGMFLHRQLLVRVGGVPEQPLMEDVELSRRLKRLCAPRCRQTMVQTSARRWRQSGWLTTVLRMWRYRLRYWLGEPAETLAADYYRNS